MATHRFARFKTKQEHPTNFRLFALTCDRPTRLLMGQKNPWIQMAKAIGPHGRQKVNCILHIGDQVYPDDEDTDDADSMFSKIFDTLTESKKTSMMLRGRELWRNLYRKTFAFEGR